MLPYKFYRFSPDSSKEPPGIIKKIFAKDPKLISLSASSTSHGNLTVIFDGYKSYWESNNTSNSWYSIKFKDYLIKLNSFSMFACYNRNCPTGFNVFGISQSGIRELICTFSHSDDTYFRNHIANWPCLSNTFYSNITFEQNKLTGENTNIFGFYFFEFFGDLYDINALRVYPCSCPINVYLKYIQDSYLMAVLPFLVM